MIRGQLQAARTCYTESAALLAGLGMPFEEAITRLEYGRLLRRLGQRRAALRELCAARSAFLALGARPFLQRCEAELGNDPRLPPVQAELPTHPRQLAVAGTVGPGKTNRQIADELYITTKTVESTSARILARLGIDSRTQIAGALDGHRAANRARRPVAPPRSGGFPTPGR